MKPTLLALILLVTATSPAAPAQSQDKPLNSTQVMAWLAGGVSNTRLIRLVKQDGTDFAPTPEYGRHLRAAGGNAALVQALQVAGKKAPAKSSPCSPLLTKAAEFAKGTQFEKAENQLRELLQIGLTGCGAALRAGVCVTETRPLG